jgi:hypothetical protein
VKETSYQDLIKQRKNCKECHNYGLCDDLNLSYLNGNLYQLETILKNRFEIESLGLWNPANNSNPLTASVLIIGQDFSNVGYFDNIHSLLSINNIESENTTNKNLIKYIKLSGINVNDIYFTNAILCIKSGSMNAPIKTKWISNCSTQYLKPLITQHLINLKMIITLGKVALDAVKKISDFSEKNSFSHLAKTNYDLNIDGKKIKLYPMFHVGNLGNVNAAKANKNPKELWEKIKLDL